MKRKITAAADNKIPLPENSVTVSKTGTCAFIQIHLGDWVQYSSKNARESAHCFIILVNNLKLSRHEMILSLFSLSFCFGETNISFLRQRTRLKISAKEA